MSTALGRRPRAAGRRSVSVASRSPYALAVAGILLALFLVTLLNARYYPASGGYDAQQHMEYADGLIRHGRIPGPETRSEYYTPPGFYAIAGVATELGRALRLGDPYKVMQAANGLLAVATGMLLLLIARLLWPGKRTLQLAALAFFAFLPVVVKAAAMFHPEMLDLFLSTLALYLAARMLVTRAFSLRSALALGATLGAGQLVRAFSLWTFAAVLLGLGAFALAQPVRRRQVVRAGLVVVTGTALVAGPWYVRQAVRYTNPVFDRPSVAKPIWERRPASFYVGTGLPRVFTRPWRPSYPNRALPTAYTELWGDYFGAFAWDGRAGPEPATIRDLKVQSVVGLLPTALAVAGWVALLVTALRRWRTDSGRLLVALLPALGLLGFLYFTMSYPTRDGDVIKATYMLTTAPVWALGFGYAYARLARRRVLGLALAAVLLASVLVELPFLVARTPLGEHL